MICKIKTIAHAKNALEYAEKGGELIHAYGVNGNAKEISKQFNYTHLLKPNIKHKSLHGIISFNPDDKKLNKGQLMEISEQYAKQHGFDKNQYAVYLHEDKKHRHLHIIANRIGSNRKVVSSSHSYAKNTDFSMKMEREYNLVRANRKDKGKDFVVKNEHNETLKTMIDECLKKSKSLAELSKNLKEQYSVTMYRGRGISFMYQEGNDKAIKTKGSAIGRGYSLKGLEKQIESLHRTKGHSKAFLSFAENYLQGSESKTSVSKGLDINIDQNISSAHGKENFEDDEELNRRKKRKNKGLSPGL